MKKIFKGHSPWSFLSFGHAGAENPESSRYLSGYTPVKKLHKAASVGDITQVQRMLEFGDVDVNLTDRKKRTALHYACAHGQPEMVTLLLWYDCNIEARDRDESTALIKATQRQHEDCVKILLENGADANAVDANQNTALHYAVYNNNASIAARLLAFHADTEVKTKNGYTPLILAVLENKPEMVEVLLQADADINALDNCKRSALIHAVRAQSKGMISLLLQQGADASLMDIYGATAQSYAVFETFQVLSKVSSSSGHEPSLKEDEEDSDTKDGSISCSQPIEEKKQSMARPTVQEDADAAGRLGSQVALEHEEKELELHEDYNLEADPCPACYSQTSLAHKTTTPKPAIEEDGHALSTKPPVVRSPMFTESSLWIGYPADWPEPIKFSRQPAVYNPIEWREDMESRLVPLEENRQQEAVLWGTRARAQTPEPLARSVSEDPGADDPGPAATTGNAEDEPASLLEPVEEKKPQMKELSVTEAARLQTGVKLERQGVLDYEEKGLESCQDSNLEAAESTDSYSTLRFSPKPNHSDPEPTTKKDGYHFDTKDKGKLEKHPLARTAFPHQAKQANLPPLQLQERSREPEMNAASDGEDPSGHSKSAKGQVLRGPMIGGGKPESKDTARLITNKPTPKVGGVCEGVETNVYPGGERPPDGSTGQAHLKPASTKPICSLLDCEDRVAAAPGPAALLTFPGQMGGDLGSAFLAPSVSKFPLVTKRLDCENSESETEESLRRSKDRSSKNTGSRKVKSKRLSVLLGEKQEGYEFKSRWQKSMKPKLLDWRFDTGRLPGSSESRGLSDSRESNAVSEMKSWSDSTLCDTCKENQGPGHLPQRPEAPARATVGPASSTSASADDLSDNEFRILEEEILAWEKVHLENASVSENLPNKCEGILSDATNQKGKYLEEEHTGEIRIRVTADSDFEVTLKSEQKSLDSSGNSQLLDKVLSTTPSQTQTPSADLAMAIHPLSEKESKQIYLPLLHLENMPEDPEINKKYDEERAPGHPEVPSAKVQEKESIAHDIIGEDREPSEHREFQHTAADVPESICPAEEPLPGDCRGRAQFKLSPNVEEMSEKLPSSGLEVSETRRHLTATDCNDSVLTFPRKCGRTEKVTPAEENHELAKSVPDPCMKKAKKGERQTQIPREPVSTLVFEKCPPEAAGLPQVKDGHRLSALDRAERRSPLKQDEKQEKAGFMFQQKKTQLRWKKEQCGENSEWAQHPKIKTVIADVKAIENDLRQFHGAQDQLTQAAQSSEKTQAILQRLEVRLSKLKFTLKEQSAKIDQIRNQLLHKGLLGDETKKLIQQTQSLECTLEKQMNENEELMTELTGFKDLFEETKKKLNKHESRELSDPEDFKNSPSDVHIPINTLRHEFHNLKEKWEATYYKYLHMVVKLQFMEQELIAMKAEQTKCGHLLKNQEDLEEEVVRLKSWLRESATQTRDQNDTENLRDANDAATISQLELRIKNMESQLAQRAAQQSPGGGVLKHGQFCAEQSGAQPVRAESSAQAKRSPRK